MQDGSDHGAADIIIPIHNDYPSTRTLLESIYRHTEHPFHIYAIDNASADETLDLDKIYSRNISIVRNTKDRGWSGAINQGIQMGTNPYLVFLYSDVEVGHGWLENMIAFLNTHPRIGAVGPLNSNVQDWQCVDRVRETMVPEIPRFFTDDMHERNRILQYHFHRTGILVEGGLGFFCSVLTRRAVEETGPLGESLPGSESADYCSRLRESGYVLGLVLDTYVVRNNTSQESSVLSASHQYIPRPVCPKSNLRLRERRAASSKP